MARRTKKVGISGRYGVRYGASLRKMAKKFLTSAHQRYACVFCGKDAIKREAVGVWKCHGCNKKLAGGAWMLATEAAASIKSTTMRLNKAQKVVE